MTKKEFHSPFFMLNPKSYLYGQDLMTLAKEADKLAEKYPAISIFVTAPFTDLSAIAKETENIIVTAQHMDGIQPGRGMGHVLPDAVYHAGARATVLNHAERPLSFGELTKSMERAQELGMVTIVCADSLKEAKAIATLNPDIILCEPTELIGTGRTSDESYIKETDEAVKDINESTFVMQGAGISTAEDVYRMISLGADGTGCTSGVVKAEDPVQTLKDMVEATVRASQEVQG